MPLTNRSDESSVYVAWSAARASHDRLLLEIVLPVAREIRKTAEMDSYFFARFGAPEEQLRFRVLGRPGWIDAEVRPRLERAAAPYLESGLIRIVEYGEYQREYDRYGGVEGMALAERIFLHDSDACLELIARESQGALEVSRREWTLVHTERFLDLMGLLGERRLEFYRLGWNAAIENGSLRPEDLPRLDERYGALRPGLERLLRGPRVADPAGLSEACLEATRPVVRELLEALARGRIAQGLPYLAWSYAHLHCNRLGIDTTAEAILRYFVYRFWVES